MKNYVKGRILNNKGNLNLLSQDLLALGYQVQGTKFSKVGKIESIVNELVPYLEKQGVNVASDLELREYKENGMITGSYVQGRVERF